MRSVSMVSMYSRRRCGLCDEARAVIQAERDRTGFDFDERFIDGDDDLEREYGLRVPVVLVDGEEAFEYHVDPLQLRRRVAGDEG
jgi:glutaredoxin